MPENVGAVLFVDVPSAGEVSVTGTFAGVSIVQLATGGLESTLPAGSVARTLKVCVPSAREL